MRHQTYIPLAMLCVLLAGCERENAGVSTTEPAPATRTNNDATALVDQAGAAAAAAGRQLAETREEATKAMTEALVSWDAKLESLKTRSEGLSETVQLESKETMAGLRREFDQAGIYLTELGSASKDTWRELKVKFDETMVRLSKAYDAAAKELKSDS